MGTDTLAAQPYPISSTGSTRGRNGYVSAYGGTPADTTARGEVFSDGNPADGFFQLTAVKKSERNS